MSYRTIVADPPWDVMGGPRWGGGSSKPLPYRTMSVDEIAAVAVRDLADRNAHLYLWTINAYLEETYEIARLWGFKPSTLLTWAKPITGGGLGWLLPPEYGVVLVCASGGSPRHCSDWSESFHLASSAVSQPEAGGFSRHG